MLKPSIAGQKKQHFLSSLAEAGRPRGGHQTRRESRWGPHESQLPGRSTNQSAASASGGAGQICTRAQTIPFPYIFPPPPQLFLFFFFSSPSQCRGFTCISEDSSEITFLLVENYNLTALDQLRKDWLRNFWSPSQSRSSSIDFHSFIANTPTGSVVKKVCPLAISLRATPLARPLGLCRPNVLLALGVCSVGAATVTSRLLVLVACSTCAPRHFATQSSRHHQHIHGPTEASMKRV